MSRLFVDAMPPFVGTWDLVVGKGGILLGFSRNSLLIPTLHYTAQIKAVGFTDTTYQEH